MGLFSKQKEKGRQLLFRDDGSFVFRELAIENSFLLEEDKVTPKAWAMPFKLLKRFDGYGKIPSGMYTISYSRGIMLDLLGQLQDTEKATEKSGKWKGSFVKGVAESRVFQLESKIKPTRTADIIAYCMGGTIVILGLCFLLKVGISGIGA
jgi:hypothetical protein